MSTPPWNPQPGHPAEQPGHPGYPGLPGYPGALPAAPPLGGPWYVPAYLNPQDPLVNPPGAGINAWYRRVVGVLRRSGGPLLAILAVTQLVPTVLIGIISLLYTGRLNSSPLLQPGTAEVASERVDAEFGSLLATVGAYMAALLVATLLVGLVQALGYAAATWVVVRAAAGEPVTLGGAFRYGARRMLGLWGWTLVSWLAIAVGLCLCILPGVYLVAALALFGPVYLFERHNPLGRAWRLFHANFGMVLGRLALLAAVVLGGQLVFGVLETILLGVLGEDGGLSPVSAATTVISSVAALPLTAVLVVGLLVTYFEQRVLEQPLSTPGLAAELA